MESNGARNRIQCSQETATLLEQAGKTWTRLRATKVKAKGKGELQTYWLDFRGSGDHSKTGSRGTSTNDSSDVSADDYSDEDKWVQAGLRSKKVEDERLFEEKINRLVDWNTDVLCRILKHIVACNRSGHKQEQVDSINSSPTKVVHQKVGAMTIDEVVEVIELPELNVRAVRQMDMHNEVALDPIVVQQLRHYIYRIACLYRNNPFHNFEHVSTALR
jgi:Adenylate and Guanylate cyclase catalytic domain